MQINLLRSDLDGAREFKQEGQIVPENVSISYRGANYAIGQGPQFYAIWAAAVPNSQPLEWWPLTPEGWARAWARFTAVEVPGTISAVTHVQANQPPASPTSAGATSAGATSASATWASAASATGTAPGAGVRNARASVGLLALGVVLGIAGLFPSYVSGASLASQPENLVLHAIYLAAWVASTVLILFGRSRVRVGALLGLGVSAVTFGLFVADVGSAVSGGGSAGAGLVLSLIGWLACTAGAGLAMRSGPAVRLSRPVGHHVVPIVTLIVAALGVAIAFAPSWDSFTLHFNVGSQTITAGNAFANPGLVIAGDLATMIAIVAVVVLAVLWRPIKIGAALVVGAVIPMVAQAISALVQLGQGATPAQFGISPPQAAQAGLTITSGVTPIFWVYCAFVATVILMCVWMLIAPDLAGRSAFPVYRGPAGAQPGLHPEALHPVGVAPQGPSAWASASAEAAQPPSSLSGASFSGASPSGAAPPTAAAGTQVQARAIQAPAVQTPTVQAPTAEAPTVQAPTAESPTAEAP